MMFSPNFVNTIASTSKDGGFVNPKCKSLAFMFNRTPYYIDSQLELAST